MPLANFPAYRNYKRARVAANDAMMALLAGSHLAMNTLRLTEGSSLRLSQIFPQVEHIKRFDQSVSKASAELRDAEPHLTVIAVPYALSLHEAFVLSCMGMLKGLGRAVKGAVNAKEMHATLYNALGAVAPSDLLETFNLLRVMRNSHIHQGGLPSSEFPDALANMSLKAKQKVLSVTARSVGDIVDENSVQFVIGDVFLAFAITNAIGQNLNYALQAAITQPEWAEIIANDYWSTGHRGGGVVEWKAMKRYAKTYYAMAMPDLVLWSGSQKVAPGRLEGLDAMNAQERNRR